MSDDGTGAPVVAALVVVSFVVLVLAVLLAWAW